MWDIFLGLFAYSVFLILNVRFQKDWGKAYKSVEDFNKWKKFYSKFALGGLIILWIEFLFFSLIWIFLKPVLNYESIVVYSFVTIFTVSIGIPVIYGIYLQFKY